MPLPTAPVVQPSQSAVILIPKLRMYFAEFLNEGFLAHLRILSLPTCVGFSTGTLRLVRSFSWQLGSCDFDSPLACLPISSRPYVRDLPLTQSTAFDVLFQSYAHTSFCVTPSSNGSVQYRNFRRLYFAYSFRLCLVPDLPRVDERCPGNLRLSVLKVSHFSFRYSYRHSLFNFVQLSFRSTFAQN